MGKEEEEKNVQGAIVVHDKDDRSRKRKLLDASSGAAWGANSYSVAKINSFKESGNDPGFDDFGRYFAEKQRKLREQYHADSSSKALRDAAAAAAAQHSDHKAGTSSEMVSAKSNTIFQGVSIFVDGFTTPTHQELRFIMMNNGGIFENYFSRQRVTHIICSTLPDNKIMNPRMLSRGLPIVKPEWIVESMNANKLLPWENYQLERIAYAHPGQQTIAARFAAYREVSPSTKALVSVDSETAFQVGSMEGSVHSVAKVGPVDTLALKNERAGKSSEPDGFSTVQIESQEKLQILPENYKAPVCLDMVPFVPSDSAQEKIKEDTEADNSALNIANDVHALEANHLGKNDHQKLASGEFVNRPFRSSLSDTDFVKNFFKFSRLHFIGTWRNRYQTLASSFGKDGAVKSKDRELMEANLDGKPMIIHLDMDCFFVSVVVRNRPDLVGKPVAVCHSDSEKGTAEISSANYPARSFGIKAGMYVRSAKALCPDLKIVSYDFAGYEEVADKVYNILHRHCTKVEAVSCDEAFLDVTGHPDPIDLASRIREEIYAATRCSASAGIAENLLLARLATKRAKPNGQFAIKSEEVRQFMAALPVDELPGVGWALQEKLHSKKLYTCADLLSISKETLQKQYGTKTGNMLWCYAQGIDDREVQPAQERKSIGAEVNWGVRFECMDDAQKFLVTLSNEVASRLQSAGSCGRTITLKIKKRREGAGEPAKYLGHGICDSLSRSETVGHPTNSAEILLRIGRQLYASLHIDPEDVRGMGLQVSRLESVNAGNRKKHSALDSWLAPPKKEIHNRSVVHDKEITKLDTTLARSGPLQKELPVPDHALPLRIAPLSMRPEANEVKHEETYESKPVREKESEQRCLPNTAAHAAPSEERRTVQQVLHGTEHKVIKLQTPPKGQRQKISPLSRKGKGKSIANKSKRSPLNSGLELQPVSRLPTHPKAARKVSFAGVEHGDASGRKPVTPEPQPVQDTQHAYYSASGQSVKKSDLVDHSFVQQILDWVSTTNTTRGLSSHLLSSRCYLPVSESADTTGLEKLIHQCVKLLTQYIRTTASGNLEEVHLSLLYMKRLGGRCKLWRAVEEVARPAFKDIVAELYGGKLAIS
ncbi:DNA repair protein REV1 [Marchantia polymorpha subsp. ruderalis]|uniref:DNA polymerase kappa n=1 Tax=Marchantia polymorpha TaxID=3197 RepID=A0A2R6VZY1_MARPO|nr:hypothetical protein MARPO_0216s0004 [Marchantia polymorpha]BBN18674.1 hypothetical protein Mp_8g04460 [Marchantia polymorpha subsp. ruderalis]|eukprot:PTQ27160.1 hypothetical protein MARPO_0216s0004 [Marchantia polymorpha]